MDKKSEKKKFLLISLLLSLLVIIIIFAANPSFNTPTLNTTNVLTNNTNQNISLSIVSTDATGLANITNWYENNISLLVLNMPFVTNNTDVKDYSGYNNNGTISGAVWQRYLNEDNNSLVLLMPFDTDNITTAIDNSDYKKQGILQNVNLNTTNSITGTSYTFTGADNSMINLTYDQTLNFSKGTYSVEAWIYPIDFSNNYIVGQSRGATSGENFRMFILGTGHLQFPFSQVTLSPTIPINVWSNIIGVYNGSTSIVYMNGVQAGSSVIGYPTSDNGKIHLGNNGVNNNRGMNGSIDNVRIYNKALTSSEIADHYNKVKLYYSPSFKFNGNSSKITANNNNYFNVSNNSYSLEVWMKSIGYSSKGSAWNCVAGKGDPLSVNGYGICSQSDNIIIFVHANIQLSSTVSFNDNLWHNVVGVHNKDLSRIEVYVDGVQKATTTNYNTFVGLNNAFIIGGDINGILRTYNGSVEGVRVYNRSLSANQIFELYNSYNTSGINKLVLDETTAGRTYKVQVYVANASDLGSPLNTSELLILDEFAYFTNNPVINSTLGYNRTTEDLNVYFTPRKNETATLNYSIEVFKNNISSFTINNIYAKNNTFTQFIINKNNISVGQTWKAQIGLKNNYTILITYSNTSELLVLENNTPIITLNYPLEGTQFTTSAVTFRYQVNDNSSINQCRLFIDNIPLKTNTTITRNVEDSYTNSTLTNGNHQWYINCIDYQSMQSNSTINNFLIDVSLSAGGTTGGGAGAGSTINTTTQINQTIISNQTIITQSKNIIQNINNEVIQPILTSTSEDVKGFIADSKIYLFLIGGFLIIMGMIPIIEKKKNKKPSLIIMGSFIGLIAYKPELSLYLTKDLPRIISENLNVNIKVGLIVIASIVIATIVLYTSFKKRKF